jgi:glycosyltransferase involved in cell wall biosynthesis
MRPFFSLIVPTRKRPEKLARFLDSVARTAAHPERVEVVLVVDDDDRASCATHPALNVRHSLGAPGRTMGALNNAGFAASTGDWVMLLNDDVIVRTPNWDAIALKCAAQFPDPFVRLHVNDTLIRHHLCVFPFVSRAFYELCGEVCPAAYRRYRIDDHIEDVFNLLAVCGERRSVYLPDVIFEHDNATQHPEAGAVYESDPAILALDAPTFEALLPMRKELALRVLNAIDPNADLNAAGAKLASVTDSFAIRTDGRQRVVRVPWWAPLRERGARQLAALKRARNKSAAELLRAIRKRLMPRAHEVTP